MWRLAKWVRKRGQRANNRLTLRNPRENGLVSEPEGKALLLKETFLPVPPHADLQDIQEMNLFFMPGAILRYASRYKEGEA
jgi:hypothetical protein